MLCATNETGWPPATIFDASADPILSMPKRQS